MISRSSLLQLQHHLCVPGVLCDDRLRLHVPLMVPVQGGGRARPGQDEQSASNCSEQGPGVMALRGGDAHRAEGTMRKRPAPRPFPCLGLSWYLRARRYAAERAQRRAAARARLACSGPRSQAAASARWPVPAIRKRGKNACRHTLFKHCVRWSLAGRALLRRLPCKVGFQASAASSARLTSLTLTVPNPSTSGTPLCPMRPRTCGQGITERSALYQRQEEWPTGAAAGQRRAARSGGPTHSR